MNWEQIDEHGYEFRAKVFDGWLVKVLENVLTCRPDCPPDFGFEYRAALAFVPDHNHEWEV